jgi:hypothetical protein
MGGSTQVQPEAPLQLAPLGAVQGTPLQHWLSLVQACP